MKTHNFFLLPSLFLLIFSSTAFATPAIPSSVHIDEIWNDWDVNFQVSVTGSGGLAAFAVGSDYGITATFIDSSQQQSLLNWVGKTAIYKETAEKWQIFNTADNSFSDLPLLGSFTPDLTSLYNDGYRSAFLYYQQNSPDGIMLTENLWTGFSGVVCAPSSSFVAFTPSNDQIFGETSAVPVPGAVWLLGSGLIGLVAMRRTN